MRGDEVEQLAVEAAHRRFVGFAQLDRPLDHRLEDRRQIAWRAVDDLQNLRGRGLPFQRLAQRLLGFLALGDVADRPYQPDSPAGPVARRQTVILHPAVFAVGQLDPVFTMEPCGHGLEAIAQCRPVKLEVVGVDPRIPIRRAQALARQAEDLDQAR